MSFFKASRDPITNQLILEDQETNKKLNSGNIIADEKYQFVFIVDDVRGVFFLKCGKLNDKVQYTLSIANQEMCPASDLKTIIRKYEKLFKHIGILDDKEGIKVGKIKIKLHNWEKTVASMKS